MCTLKLEKRCYTRLGYRNNNNCALYVYSTDAFKAHPCTYLNVGFSNKEEAVILILVKQKMER